MTQYYKILGLPENASKMQIKLAYRGLVKKYHPDLNPSEEAKKKFLLIQFAYEQLMDPKPVIQKIPLSPDQKRKKESEIRMERAKKMYRQQQVREKLINQRYYYSIVSGWKWTAFKRAAIFCAALSSLILIDFFLPNHYVKDEIIGRSKAAFGGLKTSGVVLVQLQDQGKYWIENKVFLSGFENRECYVERSWLFHQPKRIIHVQNAGSLSSRVDFSVNAIFPLSFLLLIIPLLAFYYKRPNINFTILYVISLYAVFPLTFLFLLNENRWMHLLTLGFY